MTLNFDEPMKIINYDASKIKISDNRTAPAEITFEDNKSSAKVTSSKSIEITLFGSQVITILNTDLVAKDINSTFLELNDGNGFQDLKGKVVNSLTGTNAPKAKIYKVDKNENF